MHIGRKDIMHHQELTLINLFLAGLRLHDGCNSLCFNSENDENATIQPAHNDIYTHPSGPEQPASVILRSDAHSVHGLCHGLVHLIRFDCTVLHDIYENMRVSFCHDAK